MFEIVDQTPGTITTNGQGEVIDQSPGTITIRTTNDEAGWKALEEFNTSVMRAKHETFSQRYDREQRERNRQRKRRKS
jgi:hypothetical protein